MRASGGSPVAAAHRQNTGSVTPTSHGGQSDEGAEAKPAQGDSHVPATSEEHRGEKPPAREPAPAPGGEPTEGHTPAGRPTGENNGHTSSTQPPPDS